MPRVIRYLLILFAVAAFLCLVAYLIYLSGKPDPRLFQIRGKAQLIGMLSNPGFFPDAIVSLRMQKELADRQRNVPSILTKPLFGKGFYHDVVPPYV